MRCQIFGSLLCCLAISLVFSPCGASQKGPKVGETAPAPDLTMFRGMNGPLKSWSSLKGKVVVMDFWATWCGPCLGTMPHMDDLVKKYQGRDVCFIAASIDEQQSVENLKKFTNDRAFRACAGLATKRMAADYGVTSIPTTFLIDKAGKIDAICYPTELTEKALDNMLAGNPSGLGAEVGIKFDQVSASGPKPLFNVSIRQSTSGDIGMTSGGNMMHMRGFQLIGVLSWIYDVPPTRLVSDKPWSDTRYDVDIEVPKSLASQRQDILKLYAPTALGVNVTPAKRDLPVYVLTCPDGPKGTLKPTTTHEGSFSGVQGDRLTGVNSEIGGMVGSLGYALGAVVIDETGLAGKYEWSEKIKPGDKQSVLDALRTCGLAVKQETRPVDVLDVEPVGKG